MLDLLEPGGEGLVVIDIAFDDGSEALGSEGGEAFVEIVAALAESGVVGIAEGEDGIAERGKCRDVIRVEIGMEAGGVVRRFAIAVGGGDDEQVSEACEVVGAEFCHVSDYGLVAFGTEGFGEFFAEGFGVSGLGTPCDGDGDAGWRRSR